MISCFLKGRRGVGDIEQLCCVSEKCSIFGSQKVACPELHSLTVQSEQEIFAFPTMIAWLGRVAFGKIPPWQRPS